MNGKIKLRSREKVLTSVMMIRLCQNFYNYGKMNSKTDSSLHDLLSGGIREGVYPGAVLLVAHKDKIAFFQAIGKRSLVLPGDTMQKDTIFDLASLTKPLATTLAVMKCVDNGKIDLDHPIKGVLPNPLPEEKKDITPRLILAHCAGFTDWMPFYLKLTEYPVKKRKDILRKWIIEAPLAYPAGKETLYSDLGFIILEWIIEQCTGKSLQAFLFHEFFSPLSLKRTFFGKDILACGFGEEQFAATEECPWRKKIMRGVVHDENAYALGGYSGHAGLFGTAEEVFLLVSLLRSELLNKRQNYLSLDILQTFLKRQDIVKGSTWALGWDTPTTGNSSAGKHFSAHSVGHLGFTGTSIWWDLDQDIIVIFLTNRIHCGRSNLKIKDFRPILHDRVMGMLGLT